jgi:hypothetical protein
MEFANINDFYNRVHELIFFDDPLDLGISAKFFDLAIDDIDMLAPLLALFDLNGERRGPEKIFISRLAD